MIYSQKNFMVNPNQTRDRGSIPLQSYKILDVGKLV